MKEHKIVLASVALVACGFLSTGMTQIHAAEPVVKNVSIIQKLMERFGLKQADVQSVFATERNERQTQMKQKYEDRLSALVTEGKITEAQKQLIIVKHTEMQKNQIQGTDAWKSLTREERQSQMDSRKTELEAWSKANGINISYVEGGFGKGGRFGRGK